MKVSMWMYMFTTLGITGIVLINLFGNIIVGNEQNYYLLKEVTKSAMLDSVDLVAYREGVGWDGVTSETDSESMHCLSRVPGTVRILKEKFVENFMRRFSENAELNRKYRVVIHDIDECPPKVSVSLIATQDFSFTEFFQIGFSGNDSADIVNYITGILESETPVEYLPKSDTNTNDSTSTIDCNTCNALFGSNTKDETRELARQTSPDWFNELETYCNNNCTKTDENTPITPETPEVSSTPIILCSNPKYNGDNQQIASCINGNIDTETSNQINVGDYNVTCSGSNDKVSRSICSISRASCSCEFYIDDKLIDEKVGDYQLVSLDARHTQSIKVKCKLNNEVDDNWGTENEVNGPYWTFSIYDESNNYFAISENNSYKLDKSFCFDYRDNNCKNDMDNNTGIDNTSKKDYIYNTESNVNFNSNHDKDNIADSRIVFMQPKYRNTDTMKINLNGKSNTPPNCNSETCGELVVQRISNNNVFGCQATLKVKVDGINSIKN